MTKPMAGLKPLAAILLDIAVWDSNLRSSLGACFLRVSKLVESRGLPIIMIDFPEAGKVFDHALSSGFLDFDRLPKVFGSLFSEKGLLFEQLFLKSFNYDGTIRSELDHNFVFFTRQVLYFAKKVQIACSDEAVHEAVKEFRQIDESLRPHSFEWDLDIPAMECLDGLSFLDGYKSSPDMISHRDICPRPMLRILDTVTRVVLGSLQVPSWDDLRPRHGPGATADAKTGSDKYRFPSWPRKLDQAFPAEFFAQSREDMHLEVDLSRSPNEYPARLLAVPKTLKGPRLIASEPISHQYAQGALMRWIREHLPDPLQNSINFHSQEPSRKAALAASKTGKLATVDLSSASDRLSCWVVERAFRSNPEFLLYLHACRTRWLVNATRQGERFFIKLKKYAAQGSAVTFPVQSMVYACISIAALLYEEGKKPTKVNIRSASRRVRVFGDDIILPSHAVSSLALLFSHLELKVNVGKTHINGFFRESCGMDAYEGSNVTPVYIRSLELSSTPSGLISWVDVCNNAHILGLWNLAHWMKEQIPEKFRRLIPISDQNLGCVSLRTYLNGSLFLSKVRTSKFLHRQETLALQVTNRETRRKRDDVQSLLQYFLEEPLPETRWASGWTEHRRSGFRKAWVPTQVG
jgi:hypothetical protein